MEGIAGESEQLRRMGPQHLLLPMVLLLLLHAF